MSDNVNHPEHYKGKPTIPIKCNDIARWMPFGLGNAFKYVWRAGHKENCQDDLEKAGWYLDDMTVRLKDHLFSGKLDSVLYPCKEVARQLFLQLDLERYRLITVRTALLTYLVEGDVMGASLALNSVFNKSRDLDDLLNPIRCDGPKCDRYPDGCDTDECIKKVQEERIRKEERRIKEARP